jgi:ParB-like chromosome segregation protein Spo0J
MNADVQEQIGCYRVHPIAAMFPLLQGEDYEKFKASIKQQGQLEPILVQAGILLDGRNRLRACLDLGIEPKVQEFQGSDVGESILALNIERRHIDAGVRAMLTYRAQQWVGTSGTVQRKVNRKSG